MLSILGTDGLTVLEVDDDNGSFGTLSSSIAGTGIATSGTHYVKVNHLNATGAGPAVRSPFPPPQRNAEHRGRAERRDSGAMPLRHRLDFRGAVTLASDVDFLLTRSP